MPTTTTLDNSEWIKDTTFATFRQDVLMESMNQPVLVDFWAPWCGPCRQLTPVLEKLVKAAKGKVKLVKMNIDDHPQVAGQLGVQSIPAVFAFDRAQVANAFAGALPESQIKVFIEKLIGGGDGAEIEAVLTEAQACLEKGDVSGATTLFASILVKEPEHADALAGLIRAQVQAEAFEQAHQILDSVPEKLAQQASILGAKAALELAEQAASSGDLNALLRMVAANSEDLQARFDLAIALNARQKREEAVEQLITIIRKNRLWNEEAARKQLLQFFEAWGTTDMATRSGRRALSSLLFA